MVVLEAAALGFVFGVGVYGGHRGRVERGTFTGSLLYGQVAAIAAAALAVVLLFVGGLLLALVQGGVGDFLAEVLVLLSLDGLVALVVTLGLLGLLGAISGLIGNIIGRS